MGGIGHYSLAGAVLAALAVVVACVAAVRLDKPWLLGQARLLMAGGAVLLTVASGVMVAALLGDDFTLRYVAEHSERAMPVGYKLAAFWGGQQGSVLLWAWAAALMSIAATWRRWGGGVKEFAGRMGALAVVWGFLAAVMLFAPDADPFAPAPAGLADGQGLNPLLQNPAMVAHPPILFLGYAACTVPFALLAGALLAGRKDSQWLVGAGGWMLAAWVLLTVGIVLGGWWAYVELGWGGYWAWDPVENASLLPWLMATAGLHTVMAQRHRGMLKRWNAGLIAAMFLLCIVATYLTRSGIVQSVHAFGGGTVDRYFLAFLGVAVAAVAALLAWRWRMLKSEAELEGLVSREGVLLAGSALLVVIMLTTLAGTILPVLSAAVGMPGVSVGAPFYNSVVGPMGLALAALMATAPVMAPRRSAGEIVKALGWPVAAAVVGMGLVAGLGWRDGWALAAAGIAVLAVAAMVVELARTAKRSRRQGEAWLAAGARLVLENHRKYGGQLAHVGLVLLIVGVVGSSVFKTEVTLQMKAGEAAQVGRYAVEFAGLQQLRAANYEAVEALLRATDPKGGVMELRPQKRFYFKSEQPVSEVAIRANWREDLYLVLAGWEAGGEVAAIGVMVNPLVSWVWLGAAVMALGGIVCLAPARKVRTAAQAQAAPAGKRGLAAAVN